MVISGMQKLTLLDYPGKVACLLFTQGCNFRCQYCHNSELINMCNKKQNHISEEEVFKYLEKRKGLLEGVCISGGEPLLQPDLENFLIKIKQMGYQIKLDTNGSSPNRLAKLIDNKLVDYIAMDVKNDFLNYEETSGVHKMNLQNIKKSIEIIENSHIDYEFRTTVVKQLHSFGQLENICKYIGPEAKYYIQNYRDCDTVLKTGLKGFETSELLQIQKKLNMTYPNVMVRGI